MNVDQAGLDATYQGILSELYNGEITVEDRFLNEKAVLIHKCHNCRSTFYGRPLWLINGKQPHKCYSTEQDARKVKQVRRKKPISTKKGDSTPNNKVTEDMRLAMVTLYKDGNSLKRIGSKIGVTPPTVKKHLIKSGITLNA